MMHAKEPEYEQSQTKSTLFGEIKGRTAPTLDAQAVGPDVNIRSAHLALAVLESGEQVSDVYNSQSHWTFFEGIYDASLVLFLTTNAALIEQGETYVLVEHPLYDSPSNSSAALQSPTSTSTPPSLPTMKFWQTARTGQENWNIEDMAKTTEESYFLNTMKRSEIGNWVQLHKVDLPLDFGANPHFYFAKDYFVYYAKQYSRVQPLDLGPCTGGFSTYPGSRGQT